MRVIAGTKKGRSLAKPPQRGLRPTSDRVREALFSIIGTRIVDARVVDLFAGTGAVGIEALSRGARQVTFVESDPQALRVLRANLSACGLTGCATVHAMPVRRFLGPRKSSSEAPDLGFDIAFADPPYQDLDGGDLLSSLLQANVLQPSSLVILEHATKAEIPSASGPLARLRQYRYGDTTLSVFAKNAEGTVAQ